MDKEKVKLIGIILLAYSAIHIVYFGLHVSPCVYTQDVLKLPAELQGAAVKFDGDIYYAISKPKRYSLLCTRGLDSVQYEINDQVSNYERQQLRDEGRQVYVVPRGREFIIEKVIGRSKHGITTLDSGSGPLYFLILRDSNGERYRLATPYLPSGGGIKGEHPVEAYKNGDKVVELSWAYFEDLYSND